MTSRQILVVEDEFLIAFEIKRVLIEAGWGVVGPAGTCEEALRLATGADIDGALLDAHLDGGSTGEVAAVLSRRAVPFVWVSGSGPESLPGGPDAAPLLEKPFSTTELLDAVRRLVGD
jgi:DNA-binding response OmpR family regulator